MNGNFNAVAAGNDNRRNPGNNSGTFDANWGQGAKRSMYHVTNSQSGTSINGRNLLNSRLWHGVPQLTEEQLSMFEAAYTGHTFIFVIKAPKFMTEGYYYGKDMHYQMKNLKAVIERASTGFSGPQNIMAQTVDQEDGNGRKVSHVINVTKEQGNISLRLHEFAGLPVKNAIENWLTGIYDIKSQHGNYHGNLGISGGWCLANHSMAILVVQVTPDWTTIQDAAYYYNMVPTEVPFDHFNWTKGDQTIVEDYDLEFVANEERSPAIMYAAEKYMNNRVLSMVATSVYNSRQFVAYDFADQAKEGFNANITTDMILDTKQYNTYVTNSNISEAYRNENATVVGANKALTDNSLTYVKLNDSGEKEATTTK